MESALSLASIKSLRAECAKRRRTIEVQQSCLYDGKTPADFQKVCTVRLSSLRLSTCPSVRSSSFPLPPPPPTTPTGRRPNNAKSASSSASPPSVRVCLLLPPRCLVAFPCCELVPSLIFIFVCLLQKDRVNMWPRPEWQFKSTFTFRPRADCGMQ